MLKSYHRISLAEVLEAVSPIQSSATESHPWPKEELALQFLEYLPCIAIMLRTGKKSAQYPDVQFISIPSL
eukprot:4087228-Karenia_brevis.AAC.1